MHTKQIYNLIILDESGSMQSIKSAIISGFNEVVQTAKGVEAQFPEQEHYISLLSFNGMGIKKIHDRDRAADLQEIDARSYQPIASTPLYDAIGQGILTLKNAIADCQNCHVLVTILTDGEENASKEFNHAQIKLLIEKMKAAAWTFTYIGANHDVAKVAISLSIENSLHFKATLEETRAMFEKEKSAKASYFQKLSRNEDVSKGYYDDDDKKA